MIGKFGQTIQTKTPVWKKTYCTPLKTDGPNVRNNVTSYNRDVSFLKGYLHIKSYGHLSYISYIGWCTWADSATPQHTMEQYIAFAFEEGMAERAE